MAITQTVAERESAGLTSFGLTQILLAASPGVIPPAGSLVAIARESSVVLVQAPETTTHIMKAITNIIGIVSLAALVCMGCKQSETSEVEGLEPGEALEEVSIQEGSTVKETITETTETAKEAISDASAQAQDLLAQAQKLVSEKKYAEATSLLQKLADFELSPAQQTMLDNLKTTIQKSAESGAVEEGTKAIGNVLGGEK